MQNEVFKALSDPIRREIIKMLRTGPMKATDIANSFSNLSNATISYHLSKLKEADLIYLSKDKNFIYYSLNLTILEEMLLWFDFFVKGSEKTSEK